MESITGSGAESWSLLRPRQGMQACRLKFGWSVWWREVVSYPFERSPESGSRGSPDKVFLQLKLRMRSGSRESPDGVIPQPKSEMKSGSRRSPGEVYLQSKLGTKSGSLRSPNGVYQQPRSRAEPGSRRSPGGAFQQLRSGMRSGRSLPAARVRDEVRLP